jgi:UDP-N-acetylglucosamine--N-acetylmuramyl-(pentapeptide) pyrophosphoryl-undecaprenol N-acetylglucosamine transferase
MRIAVACGGTGGHVFPGLAVARALKQRGHSVTLWLSGRDVEQASVSDWDGPVERVHAQGFQSGGIRVLGTLKSLVSAFLVCRRRMKRERPEAVLGMGSYASVGPVAAARSLGIPALVHEANVVPGRAVAFLARLGAKVGLTFAATRRYLPGARTELTGLPVRDDLGGTFDDGAFGGGADVPGAFTVLVMGGSQGARRLNETGVAAMKSLRGRGVHLRVVHLCGRNQGPEAIEAAYRSAGVPSLVFGFLREMGKAYRAADLAICRAGASSCMELAAFGVPAVLVPLPTAVRDHQTANAREMESASAAVCVPEAGLTVDGLAALVDDLRRDPARLAAMKAAMLRVAQPDAAGRLADMVERHAAGE